ncbi:unnamed protein product [Strongylus vulgaris]|uniref:Actin maturation protease n=1 Tax=Strongylus vulgaris TaxID=40348 RepID=A0A3P7JVL1_STRVU|nr:unnamed protein product [Strongylus vulgaris]
MASQLLGLRDVRVAEIFEKAKELGFTARGEMFSAAWLCELARVFWPVNAEILPIPEPNKLIHLIMSGCAVLVPYDCDKNHEPALRNGHGAHWALLVGFLAVEKNMMSLEQASNDTSVTDDDAFYVFAYHGKSSRVT